MWRESVYVEAAGREGGGDRFDMTPDAWSSLLRPMF